MMVAITSISFFIISYFLLQVWKLKPLYPDDGNWFYYAMFKKQGLKLHQNYFNSVGYFGVQWFAAILIKNKNPESFYLFKAIWFSLTNAVLILVAWIFFQHLPTSILSGIFFLLILISPKTSFILTFAEHFMILPLLLHLLFFKLGIVCNAPLLFLFAGIFASLSVHFKIVAFPAIFLFGSFTFFMNNILLPVWWWSGFLFLQFLPYLILKTREQRKAYMHRQLYPVIIAVEDLLGKIKCHFLFHATKKIKQPESKFESNYEKEVVAKTFPKIIHEWKLYWFPLWKEFSTIIGLFFFAFFAMKYDHDAVLLLLFYGGMLLSQLVQKSFFPGHVNQVWVGVILIIAAGVSELDNGYSWLLVGVLAIQMLLFTLKDYYVANKKEESAYIPNYPKKYAVYFEYARQVGKWIRKQGSATEKILVWGNMPTVCLYAEKQILHPFYTHIYPRNKLNPSIDSLLHFAKKNPPEWIVFIQRCVVKDDWNMKKLAKHIPVQYQRKHIVSIIWNGKKIDEIPIYRRNDALYKANLLEYYKITKENNMQLQKMISETDYDFWTALFHNNFEKIEALKETLSEFHWVYALAQKAIEKEQLEEAENALLHLLQLDANNYLIHLRMGEIAFMRGDYHDALDFFFNAQNINNYSPETYNNLGVLHYVIQDLNKAKTFLAKAIELCPNYTEAKTNLKQITGASYE